MKETTELSHKKGKAKALLKPYKASQEITAELVVNISEEILAILLADQELAIQHKDLPHLPPLAIQALPLQQINLNLNPLGFSIGTHPSEITRYISEIFSRTSPQDLEVLLRSPLYRDPLLFLNKLQEVGIGSFIDSDFPSFPDIITVQVYLSIENSLAEQSSISPQVPGFVIEAEHIHNKLVFDAVNLALQRHRPYGLKGSPMPWNPIRAPRLEKSVDRVVGEVISEVSGWSSMQVGVISMEEIEAVSSDREQEELLRIVRDRRLARVLTEEILGGDGVWVNYELEETQASLDLADMMLDCMVEEIIEILGGEGEGRGRQIAGDWNLKNYAQLPWVGGQEGKMY